MKIIGLYTMLEFLLVTRTHKLSFGDGAEDSLLEISSTFIRQCIKEGRDVRHFMLEKAFLYMQQKRFFYAEGL